MEHEKEKNEWRGGAEQKGNHFPTPSHFPFSLKLGHSLHARRKETTPTDAHRLTWVKRDNMVLNALSKDATLLFTWLKRDNIA